ncbi:MAG: MFS transporter, partial [Rhodospirillales bacterium]
MNRALRPGWADALAGHVRRPALIQLFLGFSSGLPYLLVFSTLSAWLRESGLSVAAIGWFAL